MLNGTIQAQTDYVSALTANARQRWPNIFEARAHARVVSELLLAKLRKYTSNDVDIVAYGSLARQEWTNGSDVDWTFLIDGQASTQHRVIAREVAEVLANTTYMETSLKPPGGEGIFGNLSFSHDIVHHIGGQADTNRNTTQRILLLLEAVAIRSPDEDDLAGPFGRIVRQILNRYLASDSNFHEKTDQESRIPRFLLNDIVRYWRTMCVDFAYKDWEQAGKKWALRNVKLRTSRKLLFVSGLLTVFSCFHNEALRRNGASRDQYLLKLQTHLLNFVRSTPVNIISWTLNEIGLQKECGALLDIYEKFLKLLNDPQMRNHLNGLAGDGAYDDTEFLACRQLSHDLQGVLKGVFFEIDSPLRNFTFEYGVF